MKSARGYLRINLNRELIYQKRLYKTLLQKEIPSNNIALTDVAYQSMRLKRKL